jgi:succinoglycan biosynthesis protein ExoU
MIAQVPGLDKPACVDVLIAVWNNASTIERAVRSALCEPDVNRVIVIDDGSADNTFSVVRSLVDEIGERLLLHRSELNAGPSAARNLGFELSRATWVAILDGDDYFRPGRIRALLEASNGADFVADDQVQIKEGENDDPLSSAHFLLGIENTIELDFATFVAENISVGRRLRKEFGFLKPMMRRSFLDRHQLRYDEQLRLGEDFALYARALAARAVFKVIPSRTYVSVVRSGSISGNHTKEDLKRLRDSDKALWLLPTLTEREIKLVQRHYESIDTRIQWLNVIDAVRIQSVLGFVSPFFIRWTTSVYLISSLLEQVVLRSKRVFGL